jgi:hypothetical protein
MTAFNSSLNGSVKIVLSVRVYKTCKIFQRQRNFPEFTLKTLNLMSNITDLELDMQCTNV